MENYWFIFCGSDLLLLRDAENEAQIPLSEEPPVALDSSVNILDVSTLDNHAVKACRLAQNPDESRFEAVALRQSFYRLPLPFYQKAGKCYELVYWDSNTQFCGRCGAPMEMSSAISKRCTQCGYEVWPQLQTAVICLITRGDEALLVHARNFKKPFYGLVAGFVETGETLEEAMTREAEEETGITIKNLRYMWSQPWPYPCGLMVGFAAEYASGELKLQDEELSCGDWFRFDALPTLPEKLSIARRLIDYWVAQKMEEKNAILEQK